MAQAKSGSTKKRSGQKARKPQARSRGSTNKASSSGSAKARQSANGAGRVEAAKHAVEGTAKDAGHAVGNAASKAKVPLLAGGAALAGAAGGMVLGARQARRNKGVAKAISRRPQVKMRSRDLAKVAKEVGSFGAEMGHLASELQHAREANGKHRSPVEVVLEGLTARRSRA